MPVPGSPGIQELNPVDVDEIPKVLGIRLFVVPRLGALPGRRAEVVGEHLRKGPAYTWRVGRPLRQTTPCVLAARRPYPSIVPWWRRRTVRWPYPVGCTSPQGHGRDFRSAEPSAWRLASLLRM